MDPATILAVITGLANLAKAVAPLVQSAAAELSSTDQAQVQAALDDLVAANQTVYDRVQAELRG